MRLLRALDMKALRDVAQLRGQLVAIALVLACGIGSFLGMRTTMLSLESARSSYYARERFAHVFAGLKRAPEQIAHRLRAIPGVQRLQTRVVVDVTLDVPDMVEAVIGRLVSLPDRGRAEVNDIRLRSGRLPEPGHGEEVLVDEAFAEAHGFPLGTTVGAIINGAKERLRIVGTALSPEFTYTVGPGQMFPDYQRFGIFWMRRAALGPAFDMEGAFNDVVLSLERDADDEGVIRRVDDILGRYGGVGAIPRRDQQSAFFIDNELVQLATFGTVIPLVFLAVAAFLMNIVIGRVVAAQREQIAALKAVGYRDREVGLHYAKIVGLVLLVGLLLGIVLAAWLGHAMTGLYSRYYRFPELPYRMELAQALLAIGVTLAAGLLGTWTAIRRTVVLPPAEAMRPEAPPTYRPTVLERLGLSRWIPPAARMVLREIDRKPVRAGLTVLGIALATALIVLVMFTYDSVGYVMNVQFGLSQRHDVQLQLFEPRAVDALGELEHLPGVLHAEPFRMVPVRLRSGPRVRNVAITGLPRTATLQAILDVDLRRVVLPPRGLVLSTKLAEVLGVKVGDALQVEVLEGHRPVRQARVARLAETWIGLAAYMEHRALCALLRETPSFNGAWLAVDERRLDDLHAMVKETPVIAGISQRSHALRSYRTIIEENLGTSVAFSLVLSLVMAFGVLFNAGRITLAERVRELASLRVLGFRRREVGAILLGELGLLTVLGVPLGLWFGHGLAAGLVRSPGFDNEQFRLPLVIGDATYGAAVCTIGLAAVVSGWSAWRKLDRIDIVAVLKTRD